MSPMDGRQHRRSTANAVYDDEFRGYRLFIGNIAPGVTEHDVCKYFGDFGEVKMVWLARDPPGFAYVVYFDRDVAEMARQKTHMCRWYNRLIKVEFAVPRGQNPRSRGNFSTGSDRRRSRSRENYHRFRSRGVRINRSRSPLGNGRRYSDSQRHDERYKSRGMFPPPSRPAGYNDDRRPVRRNRHEEADDRRRDGIRSPARDSSRRPREADTGSVKNSRDDVDSAVISRREADSKRVLSQTRAEGRGGSGEPQRRSSGADAVGEKRRRNTEISNKRNLPMPFDSDTKRGGSNAKRTDRSPGELDEDDDTDHKRSNGNGSRGRRHRDESPRENGVSRTTTRYRSPDAADRHKVNYNQAGAVRKPQQPNRDAGREESAEEEETGRRYNRRSRSYSDNDDGRAQPESSCAQHQQGENDQNADYEEDDDAEKSPAERANSGHSNRNVEEVKHGRRANGHESNGKSYAGKANALLSKQRNRSPSIDNEQNDEALASEGVYADGDGGEQKRNYSRPAVAAEGSARSTRRGGGD